MGSWELPSVHGAAEASGSPPNDDVAELVLRLEEQEAEGASLRQRGSLKLPWRDSGYKYYNSVWRQSRWMDNLDDIANNPPTAHAEGAGASSSRDIVAAIQCPNPKP